MFIGHLAYIQNLNQLWKMSKLITNCTNKEIPQNTEQFPKKSWYENIRLIPYRKIPVYRDFAKIPYRTVPEWNSSYRWGLHGTSCLFSNLLCVQIFSFKKMISFYEYKIAPLSGNAIYGATKLLFQCNILSQLHQHMYIIIRLTS